MTEVKESSILIQDVETKNIMTKSTLPVGGYSVNPYVGCTHGCKYCYASFMKRFTGHTEPWGTFLDVKHWPEIKNPKKYTGQRIVIGSVYARCEELMRPEMLRALAAEALPASLAACRVLPAALGDGIGDFAALAIAMAGETD